MVEIAIGIGALFGAIFGFVCGLIAGSQVEANYQDRNKNAKNYKPIG